MNSERHLNWLNRLSSVNAFWAWASVPMDAPRRTVRPIWCDVNISPRAHGTGLFTRGETQILSFATLGTLGEAQELG
jgi:hypothetical protein